jgi:TonB family protein
MLIKNSLDATKKKQLKNIAWFLLLSLLIHIVIADLFFSYGFKHRMVNFVEALTKTLTPEKKQALVTQSRQRQQALVEALKAIKPFKKKPRQAKLVARKGNFGWTLFDDPPRLKAASKRPEIPATTAGDIAIAPRAHATEDAKQVQLNDENAQTNELPLQATNTEKSNETTAIPIAQPRVKAELPVAPHPLATAQQKPKTSFDSSVSQEKKSIDIAERLINKGTSTRQQEITVADRIQQIDRMTDIITQGRMCSLKNPAKAPSKGSGPARTLVRGARVEGQVNDKPRNIIALTKGFIEKLEGEDGTDLIDRDGDPNIQPDLEDIKLITYESKLFWCLQAAWNQNFKYRPDLNFPEGVAYIDYTIDRCGKIVACTLIQSTGHEGLDAAILKTFKLAVPFPPFPSSFNTETYRSGQRISVHHQRYGF